MATRSFSSVSRLATVLVGLTLPFSTTGRCNIQGDKTPFAIVENGRVIPLSNPTGIPRKYRAQTLFLSTEVSLNRCSAKPPPSASPVPPKPKVKKESPAAKLTRKQGLETQQDSITVRKPSGKKISSGKSVTEPQDDPGDDYANVRNLIPDPIQHVNRGVFWFNHQLYHYVFTPLNKTYKFIFPRPVRTGISNAINNVEYPVRAVNDLLQCNPPSAGLETEKFLLNSTAGIGGLIRVSDRFPALSEVKPTDTAATLAKWGIPHGCYVVWPVIGPRSLRDTVGFAGDLALNPASWLTYGVIGGLSGTATLAVSAPQTVGNTSDKLDTYETLTRTSIDRYNAVRSAYEQNRKKIEAQ